MFRSIVENTPPGLSFSNLDGGGEDPWLAAMVLVRGTLGYRGLKEA
jgi:hypothetical protein